MLPPCQPLPALARAMHAPAQLLPLPPDAAFRFRYASCCRHYAMPPPRDFADAIDSAAYDVLMLSPLLLRAAMLAYAPRCYAGDAAFICRDIAGALLLITG